MARLGNEQRSFCSCWESVLLGETDYRGKSLVLMGRVMFSKSLIQFSVDGWGCVPSLLFDLRPNYGRSKEDKGNLLQIPTASLSASNPAAGHLLTHPSTGDSWTLMGKSGSVSCGVTDSVSWVLVHTRFCLCPPRNLLPQSCVSSVVKSLQSQILWGFSVALPDP